MKAVLLILGLLSLACIGVGLGFGAGWQWGLAAVGGLLWLDLTMMRSRK